MGAAFRRRTAERAIYVDEVSDWMGAVYAGKPAQHGFLTGGRNSENRSTAGMLPALPATELGRAVKCSVDVDEARGRVRTIAAP
jgi:hypothetical protein